MLMGEADVNVAYRGSLRGGSLCGGEAEVAVADMLDGDACLVVEGVVEVDEPGVGDRSTDMAGVRRVEPGAVPYDGEVEQVDAEVVVPDRRGSDVSAGNAEGANAREVEEVVHGRKDLEDNGLGVEALVYRPSPVVNSLRGLLEPLLLPLLQCLPHDEGLVDEIHHVVPLDEAAVHVLEVEVAAAAEVSGNRKEVAEAVEE